MKIGLLHKRIPTIAGLFILIGGLVAGVVLVNQRQNLGTRAGPTATPKDVRISNRATNTFSVSWTTDTPTTGFIKYSEDPARITTPAGDVRDQISGTAQSYTTHYVNITGLKADTTYYFVVGSGPQTYTDEGNPFQVRTGPQIVPPQEDVITGKVINEAGNPVSGTIVFVEPEGGEVLSGVTRTDGSWRLNLAAARTKEGQVLTYDKEKTILSIFVLATTGTATAITDTSKDNPVPDIVLGKNQSFVAGVPAPITGGAITSEGFGALQSAPTPMVTIPATQEATSSVTILYPAIDGEMISASQPEFYGKASPGTDIRIIVGPSVQSALIKADVNGDWKWTPPNPLSAGIHTLTLEYSEGGTARTMERTFTVLAAEGAGGLPSFTATPSATPTTTPTPTATPTATPS